jgi:Spy/CpxP family protein refolding chaperone
MLISRHLSAPATALALLASLALTPSCKDKPAETTAVDAAAAIDAAATAPQASALATDASTAMDAAADAGDHEGKRGGARGGPSMMLFQAARALELKDEQKAKLDAAEKTAHAGMDDAARDAMKAASKDLHTELVAGIKAGKIDNAKLEPKYAALEKLAAAGHAKEAEALSALHDALDATQRKAVTANVRAKQAAREAKMAHREGDGGAADGGAPHFQTKRMLGGLTRGLELDAEQEKKVDALVAKDDGKGHPDPAEMKKNVEALLTAFEKDTFDAKKLDAFDAKRARGPMEQETKLLAQLLPILKPEQREKLAAKMEKGPSPHGRRAGFGHSPILEQQEEED